MNMRGSSPHVVIVPFMAKGHTIPLVHLAHLLHRRGLATVTFLTTHANASFLRASVAAAAEILVIPFPSGIAGIPTGVESTEDLPSMSLFFPFISATSQLLPAAAAAIAALRPPPDLLISDAFLAWTSEISASLGIPRLATLMMGMFSLAVSMASVAGKVFVGVSSETETVEIPGFRHHRFSKADFHTSIANAGGASPHHEVFLSIAKAIETSSGLIVNSFHELDGRYSDPQEKPKSWFVGPLCLAAPESGSLPGEVRSWLDSKLAEGRPVLYVAFGSQAEVSPEQEEELRNGLSESGVDYLRVARSKRGQVRVEGKGLVVEGWTEQREVLRHGSVRAFMSHCGWNSLIESLCEGVPLVAWPMEAEQRLNAKLVVEELGAALRMEGSDGERGALVGRRCVAAAAREVLEGEMGRKAADRAAELASMARRTMAEGGSSWKNLEEMVRKTTSPAGNCHAPPVIGAVVASSS